MKLYYHCTNEDCDAITEVTEWPATRYDPPDSTWGDGCSKCGEELQRGPLDEDDFRDPDPPDYPDDDPYYEMISF